MKPKPKVLILGHGRHGKDTLAEIISRNYGLSFISSSRIVLEEAVWPALRAAGLEYKDYDGAFADRVNHRELWKKAISDFNTPDKTALTRKVLSRCDMYVGMRCEVEYEASKHLFDITLWIHRPNTPDDPSMTIRFDPRVMYPIYNHLGLGALEDQTLVLLDPHFK